MGKANHGSANEEMNEEIRRMRIEKVGEVGMMQKGEARRGGLEK